MPDVDTCISDIYADINFTASSGAISVPQFNSYLLLEGDAGSGRIGIESTTPLSGTPYTLSVTTPVYIIGFTLLEGTQ